MSKLYLFTNGEPRADYINIAPFNKKVNGIQVHGSAFDKLEEFIDNAEAEEIIVHDVINYLPYEIVEKIFGYWVSKLSHGGSITITSSDLYTLAQAISYHTVDPKDVLKILYGDMERPKLNSMRLQDLIDLAKNHGLKIMKKTTNAFECCVVGVRP